MTGARSTLHTRVRSSGSRSRRFSRPAAWSNNMKGRKKSKNFARVFIWRHLYERKGPNSGTGVTDWRLFLDGSLFFEFRLLRWFRFRRSDSERNPPVGRSIDLSRRRSAPLRSAMASLLESCWQVLISLLMRIQSIGYLTMETGAGEGFLGNALMGYLFNLFSLALRYRLTRWTCIG